MVRTLWRIESKHAGWAKGKCLHNTKLKWQWQQILESILFKSILIFYIQVSDGKIFLSLNHLDKGFNINPFISIAFLLIRAYGARWETKRLRRQQCLRLSLTLCNNFKNTAVHLLLPFTEAVLVQLYKMASSPNVVHIGMDDSHFSPWNTSSRPSIK